MSSGSFSLDYDPFEKEWYITHERRQLLCDFCREQRIQQGISRSALGNMTGIVEHSQVYEIERGNNKSIRCMLLIMEALGYKTVFIASAA